MATELGQIDVNVQADERQTAQAFTDAMARALAKNQAALGKTVTGGGAGGAGGGGGGGASGGVGPSGGGAAAGISVASVKSAIRASGVIVAMLALKSVLFKLASVSGGLSQEMRRLAQVSGPLAATAAISDIRQLFRDMQSAQRVAPALSRAELSKQDLLDAFQPVADAFTIAMSDLQIAMLSVADQVANSRAVSIAGTGAFKVAKELRIREALEAIMKNTNTQSKTDMELVLQANRLLTNDLEILTNGAWTFNNEMTRGLAARNPPPPPPPSGRTKADTAG